MVVLKARSAKLKRGSTGVPVYMSLASFAGVVRLLLFCADAFDLSEEVWDGIVPRCVQDGTPT